MKQMMKNIFKYAFSFIVMMILAIALLMLSSIIPKALIKNNVRISSEVLYDEGEYFFVNSLGRKLLFHNSTDAIMLNIVYSMDDVNKFDSIMKARRNYIPGGNQQIVEDEVGNLLHEGEEFFMTEELAEYVNNNEEQKVYEYLRYWHGYIPVLRFMLIFGDIIHIRMFFQLMVFALLGLLFYGLVKKKHLWYAIAVLVSFFALDVTTWVHNIQGMFVNILTLIYLCLMVFGKIDNKNFNFSLFIMGILIAYFDFLTVPLLSFLLPVIFYNLFYKNENKDFWSVFGRLFKNALAWGCGYVLFWLLKWIIVDLIYGTEIVKLAINQILYRTGINSTSGSTISLMIFSLSNNLFNYLDGYNFVLLIVLIVMRISTVFETVLANGKTHDINLMVYYICMAAPYLWYLLTGDHSAQHYVFTYRLQLAMVMSLGFVFVDGVERLIAAKKKESKND